MIKPSDKTLFRKAMEKVTPLNNPKKLVGTLPEKSFSARARQEAAQHTNISLEPMLDLPITTDSYLSFSRPGVAHKTLRNLRKGQYNGGAMLDLHGLTMQQAYSKLHIFIKHCQQIHENYFLVIHGKGYGNSEKMPILKMKTFQWLSEHPDVLACCSALNRDGGTGALYVLLKMMR